MPKLNSASNMAVIAGHEINYVDEGDGPALLLLHGNPTSSLVWRGVIDRLSGDFRCVAPDYPGFGHSRAANGYGFTPAEHAQVVAGLVDHLDLDGYVLAGANWGGPIGITAASRAPQKVRGLVMANTWAWPVNGDLHFEYFSRLAGGAAGRWLIRRSNLFINVIMRLGHRLRDLTAEEMDAYRAPFATPDSRKPIAVLPGAILDGEFLATCERALEQLADLPAVIVWADRDIAFRAKERERWEQILTNATTVPVPGAGTFVQSDAPDQVASAIRAAFAHREP